MGISSLDIQKQRFRTRAFGYDKTSVDHFLEAIAEEIERLVRQNIDKEEELAKAKASLSQMVEREATIKDALLTTQKVTDELKAAARREVELMMADAELRAERLMRGAEDRRTKLIEEIQEIRRQKIDFETSLRALLEKHVRMLDLNVVSIEEEGGKTRMIEEPLPFEGLSERKNSPPTTADGPEEMDCAVGDKEKHETLASGTNQDGTTEDEIEFFFSLENESRPEDKNKDPNT